MISPCMSDVLTTEAGAAERGVVATLLRMRLEGVAVGSSALTALSGLRLKGMMGWRIVDVRYGRDAGSLVGKYGRKLFVQ